MIVQVVKLLPIYVDGKQMIVQKVQKMSTIVRVRAANDNDNGPFPMSIGLR
jgi:hypothetical protein